MLKAILLAAAFLAARVCFCQVITVDYLTGEPQQLTEKYTYEKAKYITLSMDFAKDSIKNPQALKKLKNTVTAIDLVYTDFRETRSFDQPDLNRKRLENLMAIAPWIFDISTIRWRFIAQTGCTDAKTCKDFFHGFVIYTIKEIDEETLERDRRCIDSAFAALPFDTITTTSVKKIKTKKYYEPKRKWKKKKGIKYRKRSIWNRKKIVEYDTLYKTSTVIIVSPRALGGGLSPYLRGTGGDTVVAKVLERNSKWDSMLVVVDVTGSMGPYTSQLLTWIAVSNAQKKGSRFVFFNDGDMKSDGSKKAMKTGGIYKIADTSLVNIVGTMRNSMAAGGGGDAPENDVEALKYAFENFPECKEAILIADNNADMRDYSYLAELKKPVRVILCGSMYGRINHQYLQLAMATGGSVHTMESDLTEISKLSEGSTIELEGAKYKVSSGKFVLTR